MTFPLKLHPLFKKFLKDFQLDFIKDFQLNLIKDFQLNFIKDFQSFLCTDPDTFLRFPVKFLTVIFPVNIFQILKKTSKDLNVSSNSEVWYYGQKQNYQIGQFTRSHKNHHSWAENEIDVSIFDWKSLRNERGGFLVTPPFMLIFKTDKFDWKSLINERGCF